MRVFRGRLSNVMCVLFPPFSIEGRMWDVIVLVLDHYLSIYLRKTNICDKRDDFGIDIVNVNSGP